MIYSLVSHECSAAVENRPQEARTEWRTQLGGHGSHQGCEDEVVTFWSLGMFPRSGQQDLLLVEQIWDVNQGANLRVTVLMCNIRHAPNESKEQKRWEEMDNKGPQVLEPWRTTVDARFLDFLPPQYDGLCHTGLLHASASQSLS